MDMSDISGMKSKILINKKTLKITMVSDLIYYRRNLGYVILIQRAF